MLILTYKVVSKDGRGFTYTRYYDTLEKRMSSKILPELLTDIARIRPDENIINARLDGIIEIL